MKSLYWKPKELDLLEEWDWVKKYIDGQIAEHITDADYMRLLMLEAKLMLSNKLLITYNNYHDGSTGIITFKEYISAKEKNHKLMIHPINFKTLGEYKYFISRKREEYFVNYS